MLIVDYVAMVVLTVLCLGLSARGLLYFDLDDLRFAPIITYVR